MMKIVIIDDEPDICFVLAYEIKSMGYAPIAFENSEDAQNYLRTNEADAIICDFHMPKINGYELFQWLKENNKTTPFILLTGEPGLSPEKLLVEGMHSILLKPKDLDKIESTLNRIFCR
jgi:DNA-binding NtrC family response regulator